MALTYTQAGVNIDEGDRFVNLIKGPIRSTFTKRVLGDLGGFGGMFDARFKGFKSPVLVSSVDGVGTKLRLAQLMNRHDTVGEDLVNHCVNDILTCGAHPLFFLDYFATGTLSAEIAAHVVTGFVKACRENECALIGGETAEMPGFYQGTDYDIAGTIVGVVEKKKILTGSDIRKGDVLIGLPSTGLHTNGYSLARAVLLKKFGASQHIDELGGRLGDMLLAVHRSYLKVVSPLLQRFEIRGLSHITGGGIIGNTMRILPKGLDLMIDWNAWERPPIFRLIQRIGDVPEEDMRRTFNLGVGMIIVASKKEGERIVKFLRKQGEPALIIGRTIGKDESSN